MQRSILMAVTKKHALMHQDTTHNTTPPSLCLWPLQLQSKAWRAAAAIKVPIDIPLLAKLSALSANASYS